MGIKLPVFACTVIPEKIKYKNNKNKLWLSCAKLKAQLADPDLKAKSIQLHIGGNLLLQRVGILYCQNLLGWYNWFA